jgi:hypothetical protein
VEKAIKELPLPEKVKAIAIYKRYKEIKRIEEEMNKATREIEKKYLKHDEPVLNNVHLMPPRSPKSSRDSATSSRKNSKISKNTSTKKKSSRSPNTSTPAKSRATGINASTAPP